MEIVGYEVDEAGSPLALDNGRFTGTYTYIPKKNVDFIKMLGEKALLCAFLKDLQKEQKAVNAFLKSYESGSSKVEQLLSQSSYQAVIAQAFQPVSEDLKEWSRAEYERNRAYETFL